MEWDIKLPKAYSALSRDDCKGRNPFEGTLRGYGLERGNIPELCRADSLFNEAINLARGRSFLHWPHIMNLYMLTRFFMPQLPAGHIVEFGSYLGGSAIFMARVAQESLPNARVYGFDTFTGMPPSDPGVDARVEGDLQGADIDALPRYVAECGLDNLAFIQGLFEDTAASALAEIGPVALVHIDCDIYSAVAYAYNVVKPHLVDGAYIVFDDPLYGHCLGAFEAVEERLIRRDGLHAEQTYPTSCSVTARRDGGSRCSYFVLDNRRPDRIASERARPGDRGNRPLLDIVNKTTADGRGLRGGFGGFCRVRAKGLSERPPKGREMPRKANQCQ